MEKKWGEPRPTIYLAVSYTSTSDPAGITYFSILNQAIILSRTYIELIELI